MRKAQMEMIGLVFIVLIIVVGIVLYLRFSTRDTLGVSRVAVEVQGSNSFLTSLAETEIPQCKATVARVARACKEGENYCLSGDPCGELHDTFSKITEASLVKQGVKFDLRLEGSVRVQEGCAGLAPPVSLSSASVLPVILSTGQSKITLSICR